MWCIDLIKGLDHLKISKDGTISVLLVTLALYEEFTFSIGCVN